MPWYRIISLFPPWFANGRLDLACREGLIDALLYTTSSSVEKKMLVLWLYSPLPKNLSETIFVMSSLTRSARTTEQAFGRYQLRVLDQFHISCTRFCCLCPCCWNWEAWPWELSLQRASSRNPQQRLTACSSPQAWHQCCSFADFSFLVSQGERVAELILHHARANQCQDIERFKSEMAELVTKVRGNTIALGKASPHAASHPHVPVVQHNFAFRMGRVERPAVIPSAPPTSTGSF